MSQDSDLNPRDILNAIGISAPRSVTPVAGGSDTAIWRVEDDTKVYALRVFRPEQATVAQREIQALASARQGGLPVPAVHASATWRPASATLPMASARPTWTRSAAGPTSKNALPG